MLNRRDYDFNHRLGTKCNKERHNQDKLKLVISNWQTFYLYGRKHLKQFAPIKLFTLKRITIHKTYQTGYNKNVISSNQSNVN